MSATYPVVSFDLSHIPAGVDSTYTVRCVCPHASSNHIVTASIKTVIDMAPSFGVGHRAISLCACPNGALTIMNHQEGIPQ